MGIVAMRVARCGAPHDEASTPYIRRSQNEPRTSLLKDKSPGFAAGQRCCRSAFDLSITGASAARQAVGDPREELVGKSGRCAQRSLSIRPTGLWATRLIHRRARVCRLRLRNEAVDSISVGAAARDERRRPANRTALSQAKLRRSFPGPAARIFPRYRARPCDTMEKESNRFSL